MALIAAHLNAGVILVVSAWTLSAMFTYLLQRFFNLFYVCGLSLASHGSVVLSSVSCV